jgi:hypothetical protein
MKVLAWFVIVWAVIGSYAFSWYVLDTARHEIALMEQHLQTEADALTRELEAKVIERIFQEGRRKVR